jgi:hypothetical protein
VIAALAALVLATTLPRRDGKGTEPVN